ncbi:M28 family metallopeptidase [Desertivirga arenae]|uniref:M28 family metallopeptidase n=1 Tax=Desertivirga arenae TaxID=2810309 RepID=UPI001A95E2E0|nr:M28 family peptidase [Pedobacter sp. SYSU D00823]
MKALSSTLLLLISSLSLIAQDKAYAQRIIEELTSERYFGRGYIKDGLDKSREFIVKEFKKWDVAPMSSSGFLQKYSFPVNTFPGDMMLELNGKKLRAGIDFIVSPESAGLKASGKLLMRDSIHYMDPQNRLQISFLKKLTWSVAGEQATNTSIFIDHKLLEDKPESYSVSIENKFIESFPASNICGIIKGSKKPDSLILITAHYDHLGGMGQEVYFPGANDNGSGISLLLNLAKYYSKNSPDYSIGFICFSGEEAGLLGSAYFSKNPMIDLKKIRFLINLDLTGTGEEGITVVNASVFKNEFALLNKVNDETKYLSKITPRGKAANSDHYWFSEIGIPSFFIYTNGGIKAYHDVYDKAETLPLTEFEDLFKLIVSFNKKIMASNRQ